MTVEYVGSTKTECGAGTLPSKTIKYRFMRGSTPREGARLERKISLCGAGVAHSLGKGEATSSNLVKGKFRKEVGLFKTHNEN